MSTSPPIHAVKHGKPAGPRAAKPRKISVTLRLSADVLAAFRATGRGWQTRIDAVLREAVACGRV